MSSLSRIPEPCGPPEPVTELHDGSGPKGLQHRDGVVAVEFRRRLVAFVIAGGVMLGLGMCFMEPTMGATRSAQLKWEQREAEIARAIAQTGSPDGKLPTPAEPTGDQETDAF